MSEGTTEEPKVEPTETPAEEPKVETPVEEPKVEEPKVETPPVKTESELAGAIRELKDALKPQMTAEQRDAQISRMVEQTGFSREQLKFLAEQTAGSQVNANLATELGKMKMEKALGEHTDSLREDVENYMRTMPLNVQANPQAWEDAAFLIKGKKMDTLKSKGTPSGGGGKVAGGGNIPNTRSSATPKATSKKEYTNDERTIINQFFQGDAEAYEKERVRGKSNFVEKFDSSSTSRADSELARLTAGNT